MVRGPILLAGSFLVSGCIDLDTSPDRIRLVARVENVDLEIEQRMLVSTLSGEFDLVLTLGDKAAEESVVERSPSLVLVREEDRSLVRNLDALPSGVGWPLSIAPGDRRTLPFSLTTQNTIVTEHFETVCSGEVVLAGGVDDGSDRSVQFESEPFALAGCP